jgi:putative ABC transport system permease protein
MHRHTPLAWKNLTHAPRRLAVAVSGVTFAVLLIFMELGFLNALLESTVQILRKVDGELVIVSSAQYALMAGERFTERRMYQAREVEGVARVSPIYYEALAGILRPTGKRGRPIRVLAVDPGDPVLRIPELKTHVYALDQPETALADITSQRDFEIPRNPELLPEYEAELNGTQVHIVGNFRLGVDFATNGNLLMTSHNFVRYFPFRAGGRPLSVVDLAVVKIDKGADPKVVQGRLQAALPMDVQPLLVEELIAREKAFWATTAPIGFVFWVGAVMGFIVGIVICYQIIHADIMDHLREFATLKAMGYQSPYFIALVLRQCLYMAAMGFVPGLALSGIAYWFLGEFTGLTVQLSFVLAGSVFLATAAMCTVSGLLAVSKLLAADPAELF